MTPVQNPPLQASSPWGPVAPNMAASFPRVMAGLRWSLCPALEAADLPRGGSAGSDKRQLNARERRNNIANQFLDGQGEAHGKPTRGATPSSYHHAVAPAIAIRFSALSRSSERRSRRQSLSCTKPQLPEVARDLPDDPESRVQGDP